MSLGNNNEKIYLGRKIELIVGQEIGIGKVIDKLKKFYKTRVFRESGDITVIIEARDEETKKGSET